MRGVASTSSSFALPPQRWKNLACNWGERFSSRKSLEGEEETLLSPTFFFYLLSFFEIRMNVFPLSSSPSYLSRKEEEKKEGRAIAVEFFFLLLLPLPPNTTLSLSLSLGLSGVENELNQVLPPPTSPHSTKAQFTRDNFFAVCKKAAF